jgi:membrane-associated phospholipid phosphatase
MNTNPRDTYRSTESAVPWQSQVAEGQRRLPPIDFGVGGIGTFFDLVFAKLQSACGAFEWVVLSYLAFSSALILAFADHVRYPFRLVALQGLVATLILMLCFKEAKCSTGNNGSAVSPNQVAAHTFWHFWRHWYPHLFFLFCFEELGQLMHLVKPQWQDPKLIAFDHWLTGVHPAIWLERFAAPALNEFMQFAYFTYFTYLLVLGGILYYRKDWRAYWSVMTYSAVGYAVGYVIAIFFPVQSPWFAMAGSWHGELNGGPFTALINFIEHFGRVRGAAFPSEHVAGSFAALWGAWRHRRWLFWVMLPLVLCMCASTVYGRYHYVADVFGGMITGTLGYLIGRWIMSAEGAVVTSDVRRSSLGG